MNCRVAAYLIGIGLPIAEEPSLITSLRSSSYGSQANHTDCVYGDSAVTDEISSKTD